MYICDVSYMYQPQKKTITGTPKSDCQSRVLKLRSCMLQLTSGTATTLQLAARAWRTRNCYKPAASARAVLSPCRNYDVI